MKSILRRNILVLMLGATTFTLIAPLAFDTPALAKDGGSDSDSSGSGGGGNSGSGGGSGSGGDSGGDDSGSDSDSDSDGDHSGSGGHGSDDDSGDDNDDSDDNDDDDSDDNDDDDDDSKKDKDNKKAEKAAARPTVTLSLSADDLAAVKAGTSVVVDQLGRQLEVSIRTVNGTTVVSGKPHGGAAKRNPGPITTVSVVAANSVPGDDDGTPDQGQGDN